ncbi:SIMPL domain-containing protein [Aeromonas schubertii]|uniref:SIMPL domain-containing protein n=1 Tax=Aeromonas schubertii TaxID=652 RepID=A0ABS7VE76_9GAMM|nr:SIMPL domain-containing protein [Aeromonas schubertii]KUE79953.1 hypothetical protein ATO46_17375 [Aeromonas schubertii]MBZ6067676.1 SIMPL domain-containing protein [Aeromonas schubertii]MBZ6073187.1 SIMPL domain-containing protein [Aeromonas schubertii]QCG47742.1 DUF541 domain-containing protein [Aeromonas schubertii]
MFKSILPLSVLFLLSPAWAIEAPTAAHVSVSGVAERKVEPDMATLSVSVTALQKDGLKAKQQVDAKVAAFFGKLEGLGIKRSDVDAGNLVVSPEYQYAPEKKPQLLGYRAQRQLSVRLYQLEKLSQLMETALGAGLETVSQIEYGLKDAKEEKEKVRLAAVEDAKAKAQSLANGFGAKLGKIYAVEYDAQQPAPVYGRNYKMMAMAAPDAQENTYQQQSIVLSDRVEAVFLLE